MSELVTALGLASGAVGALALARPRSVSTWMLALSPRAQHLLASVLRIALGTVLLVGAPDCRLTLLLYALGGIALAAGVAMLLIGPQAASSLTRAWFELPTTALRVWGVAGLLFGAFLVHVST